MKYLLAHRRKLRVRVHSDLYRWIGDNGTMEWVGAPCPNPGTIAEKSRAFTETTSSKIMEMPMQLQKWNSLWKATASTV
jgi:hypothetical protein